MRTTKLICILVILIIDLANGKTVKPFGNHERSLMNGKNGLKIRKIGLISKNFKQKPFKVDNDFLANRIFLLFGR